MNLVAKTTEFTLRPYQQAGLEALFKAFQTHTSALVVWPTGTGKTVMFTEAAKHVKGRVMVIVHRQELLHQAVRTIYTSTGEFVGIEKAEMMVDETVVHKPRIVVASVQTLNSKRWGARRLERFDPNEFDLLIFDEAHHVRARTWERVTEWFKRNPRLRIAGVTATPDRYDMRSLGKIFETVAHQYEIADAVNDGWLVRPVIDILYADYIDLSVVGVNRRDFVESQLAAEMEKERVVAGMANEIVKQLPDKRTLIFTASKQQAARMALVLNSLKPGSADYLTDDTPDNKRRLILEQFANREIMYLANVAICTEGFDDPGIEAIVMGRPTMSRAMYAQMMGRGLRPLPGLVDGVLDAEARRQVISASSKPNVLVLDFAGNSGKHKLVTAFDVLAGSEDRAVADRASEAAKRSGKPIDVIEGLEKEKAAELERKRKEAERRLRIRVEARYRRRRVNPFDVLDIEDTGDWKAANGPIPDWLASWLESRGVPTDGMSYREAMMLKQEMLKRHEMGLATYKQVNVLKRLGLKNASLLTKGQAGYLISKAKAGGWRLPGYLLDKWSRVGRVDERSAAKVC